MLSAVAPWPNVCRVSSTKGSPELGRGSTHLLPNRDNLSQERYRLLGRHLQWPENKKNVFQRSRRQNEAKANMLGGDLDPQKNITAQQTVPAQCSP